MGIVGTYSRVKWSGQEANHSPTPNADVNARGAIRRLPPYVFMAQHRDTYGLRSSAYGEVTS